MTENVAQQTPREDDRNEAAHRARTVGEEAERGLTRVVVGARLTQRMERSGIDGIAGPQRRAHRRGELDRLVLAHVQQDAVAARDRFDGVDEQADGDSG